MSEPLEAPPHPAHDKLIALENRNEVVGDFLTWLAARGYVICRHERVDYGGHRLVPVRRSTEAWIEDFFELDRSAIEAEKREMLAFIRSRMARS